MDCSCLCSSKSELLNLGAEDVGAGAVAFVEAMKAMSPGSDLTVVYYFDSDGGKETAVWKKARDTVFSSILELLKRGTIREYKRIVCFDHDVLANDHELKSGLLRVGEGPGTIGRVMGDHCRRMMETKGVPYTWPPSFFELSSHCLGWARLPLALTPLMKVTVTGESRARCSSVTRPTAK